MLKNLLPFKGWELVSRLDKLLLVLWSLFFILYPFYIFKSGYPQLAHFLMLGIIILTLKGYDFRSLDNRTLLILKVFGILVAHIMLVNLAWSVILGNMVLLNINTLYYAYNFAVFLVFVILYKTFNDKIILFTLYGILGSVLIQTTLSLFFLETSAVRQILFFNNPNQLGYYALICATLFAIINTQYKVKLIYEYLFYLMVGYLVFLSLSKAAIVGLVILFIVLLKRRFKLTILLMLTLLVIYPIVDTYNPILTNVVNRVEDIGHARNDNLAGRGYDRIVNHPQYLFFGAGEGMHSRFESKLSAELHSGLGTLLFSYGIIGLGLFLYLVYLIIEPFKDKYIYLMYLLPILFYSLTHQNLRWPLFWITLGVIAMIGNEKKLGNKLGNKENCRNN